MFTFNRLWPFGQTARLWPKVVFFFPSFFNSLAATHSGCSRCLRGQIFWFQGKYFVFDTVKWAAVTLSSLVFLYTNYIFFFWAAVLKMAFLFLLNDVKNERLKLFIMKFRYFLILFLFIFRLIHPNLWFLPSHDFWLFFGCLIVFFFPSSEPNRLIHEEHLVAPLSNSMAALKRPWCGLVFLKIAS